MEEKRVPTHIIHWQNDMLMTFDQFGEQMPEYQGMYEETINKIPAKYHYLIERQQWAGTVVTGTVWGEIEETQDILSDPEQVAAIQQGLGAIERGETVSLEEARKHLFEHD